jgi:hypothetical protein
VKAKEFEHVRAARNHVRRPQRLERQRIHIMAALHLTRSPVRRVLLLLRVPLELSKKGVLDARRQLLDCENSGP